MRYFIFAISLQLVWSTHHDLRPVQKPSAVPLMLERHYSKLSSVLEFSPYHRWQHLNRNLNYADYRAHKYLLRRFLPFNYANSHFSGIQSQSPNLHGLRPYPTDFRTLEIKPPSCDQICQKNQSLSPFLFNDSNDH